MALCSTNNVHLHQHKINFNVDFSVNILSIYPPLIIIIIMLDLFYQRRHSNCNVTETKNKAINTRGPKFDFTLDFFIACTSLLFTITNLTIITVSAIEK